MNLIQRFTKKPVTIEAIQFADDPNTISNIHGFLSSHESFYRVFQKGEGSYQVAEGVKEPVVDGIPEASRIEIDTLEGTMTARIGDWIIKGVKGEFYPCKADIFESTYVRANTGGMSKEQKDRILAETQESANRLNKLNAFMASEAFPKLPREDKDLLYSQQRVMSKYVQILGKRLERAGQQFEHAPTP